MGPNAVAGVLCANRNTTLLHNLVSHTGGDSKDRALVWQLANEQIAFTFRGSLNQNVFSTCLTVYWPLAQEAVPALLCAAPFVSECLKRLFEAGQSKREQARPSTVATGNTARWPEVTNYRKAQIVDLKAQMSRHIQGVGLWQKVIQACSGAGAV
eukprot:scaffold140326_cov19-Tisochrysis_lutea.AAC.1